MCKQPTINGQPGYSWNGEESHTLRVLPPSIPEGATLLFDEPGRCGHGIDSHCHHFRVYELRGHRYCVVRHGGGEQTYPMRDGFRCIDAMDSDGRYWLLQATYHTIESAMRDAARDVRQLWELATIQKRVKVRRRGGRTRIEFLPAVAEGGAA